MQRDWHIDAIAKRGRMCWQRTSGYNLPAFIRAGIARFKRITGGKPHSRTGRRQETELVIAVGVLSRMLELGRQEYVRIPRSG